MSIKLDEIDVILLTRLNEDGRTTYSSLSTELGITVPTVKSRIDKLIKIGVIGHIGIYLNPHSLTQESSAMIMVRVNKKNIPKFLEYMKNIEEIKDVYEVLDEYNIFIITQHLPLNIQRMVFEDLRDQEVVEKAQIKVLTKEIQSHPHIVPKHSILLNIKCEYCGKTLSESYESEKLADVRHFFCCRSCLTNYKKWWEKQLNI